MLRELVDRFAYRYRLWAGETQATRLVLAWHLRNLPSGSASLRSLASEWTVRQCAKPTPDWDSGRMSQQCPFASGRLAG